MGFLETVRCARSHLEEQDRVSLRALKREFDLDEDALDELVGELVEVQQVAVREGQVLVWAGPARSASPPTTSSSGSTRQRRASSASSTTVPTRCSSPSATASGVSADRPSGFR